MENKYTPTAVALHWLIALLILALIGLGWYMTGIPKGTPERSFFYNLHKSIGLVTAALIALRILWRIRHAPPPLPAAVPLWQVKAAKASHHLLYACMVVQPTSGYIASNFTKFGVKFFGYPLPPWGWESKTIYDVFNGIHVYASYLFVALIAIHVAAALMHLFSGDGVFQRMAPFWSASRPQAVTLEAPDPGPSGGHNQ